MTRALFDVDETGRPDFDTVYTRCAVCGLVGTSSYANYQMTPAGELDPAREIALTCPVGGHPYAVTTVAFLERDAVRLCGRVGCGTEIACPSEADEVVCPQCRLHQPGPFLDVDPERRAYVAQIGGDFATQAQAMLRRRREQP